MPLPSLVTHHRELLTLNSNELPIYKDIIPGVPGVDAQPLLLDPHRGVWVLRVIFHPGVTLPTHYHTGNVHLWTLSGKWWYLEYPNQPQTAGSYLYEPGSSVHTFHTPPSNTGPTEAVMVIEGTNINFDAQGNYLGTLDANSIILMLDQLHQASAAGSRRTATSGPASRTTRCPEPSSPLRDLPPTAQRLRHRQPAPGAQRRRQPGRAASHHGGPQDALEQQRRSVTRNWNSTSLLKSLLTVEALKPSEQQVGRQPRPRSRPAAPRLSDSASTDTSTGAAPKPSARSVADLHPPGLHRGKQGVDGAEQGAQGHDRGDGVAEVSSMTPPMVSVCSARRSRARAASSWSSAGLVVTASL